MPPASYNPPDGYDLTADEAAERLGVTRRTLDRFVHRRLIVPWRLHPTAKRFFSTRDIDALREAPHHQ